MYFYDIRCTCFHIEAYGFYGVGKIRGKTTDAFLSLSMNQTDAVLGDLKLGIYINIRLRTYRNT
jgi:hypothetical protein